MPEWVFLDCDVLRAARQRAGFSYETLARELHVSAKTWERYEKSGRVPRPMLAAIAEILGLEIETPARQRVTVRGLEASDREQPTVADIRELLLALDRRLDTEVLPRLDALAEQLRELAAATARV